MSVWGGVAQGVAGLVAGRRNWRWRKDERRKANEFSKYMASTQHQREVADLRAAGLNPILTATGGPGAAAPIGQMAHPPQLFASEAIAGAVDVMKKGAEIDKIKQEISNLKVSENLTSKQIDKLAVEIPKLWLEAEETVADIYGKEMSNLRESQRIEFLKSEPWLSKVKEVSDNIGVKGSDLTQILNAVFGRIKIR